MMTHARPAINVKFRCWMGLISVAGQYALFPVWLMMWENLIYGQFDILSLNKCSPVNAEINKSPYRFLVPHTSPRVGDERAAAASSLAVSPSWPPGEWGACRVTTASTWSVVSQQYSASYLSMLNLNIIFSFSTFYLLLLYFKSQRNNIY